MELNKIFAAVLLAGVIAMTTGFLADLLVAPKELEENAYVVDVGEETQVADGAAAEEEGIPDIATLLADADVAAGEGAFRACAACHTYEKGGPNRVGPNLWGVVGGPMAHIEDFNYSDALMQRASEGGEWTWENLNGFIHAPREWLPGTAMSYAGLKNDQERANLLAWLNQQSDNPIPLPEPTAAEETAEAPAETGEAETAAAEPASEGEGVSQVEAAAEEDMADAPSTPSAGDEAAATGTEQASAAEPTDAETVAAEEVPAPATGTDAAQAEEPAAAQDAAPVEDSQPLEIAQAEEPAAAEEGAPAEESQPVEVAQTEEPAAAEEAPAEEAPAEEAGAGADGFVAQVAAADPSAGQGVARACMACHTFEQGGGNRVGPNLWDVVGRDIASVEGFRYSQAMQDYAAEHGQWSIEELGAYLAAPREVVPGTNMAYAGVRSEEDLAALVAWLRTLSDSPVPLE